MTEPASRPATAWSSDGPNSVGRGLGVAELDAAAGEDEEEAAAEVDAMLKLLRSVAVEDKGGGRGGRAPVGRFGQAGEFPLSSS